MFNDILYQIRYKTGVGITHRLNQTILIKIFCYNIYAYTLFNSITAYKK